MSSRTRRARAPRPSTSSSPADVRAGERRSVRPLLQLLSAATRAAPAAGDHDTIMLILRSSPASPFVRKIRIAASVLGLDRRHQARARRHHQSSDTVRQQNPLGKIPTLVLEDGSALFDSRVILEYLDHRAGGGRIIPKDATARFAALRLQALADGILDASILLVYEGRWRAAERHEPKWVEHQAGKVARGLAALEAAPPALDAPSPMSARSRSPARSAIATSASATAGARTIRGWSPGSTASPRACRHSPPPSRRRPERINA